MKFITSYSQTRKNDSASRLIFLLDEKQVNLQMGTSDTEKPLLQGDVDFKTGTFAAENAENTQAQVNELINQAAESSERAAVQGRWKSRLFNPNAFTGFVGIEARFFNPAFWAYDIFNPKSIAISQVKEAVSKSGNPADLLRESPLINDGVLRSLLDPGVQRAISAVSNSGSGMDERKISLTSIEYLESVFEARYAKVSSLLTEQNKDFVAKINNEVWWKKLGRKLFIRQDKRIDFQLKQMRRATDVGHAEIMGILETMKQTKEQQVRAADQYLRKQQERLENAGDTVGLDNFRKTLADIAHNPEGFIRNPARFSKHMDIRDFLGPNYKAIDLVDALKRSEYLQPIVETNQWRMSHSNALSNIASLRDRKHRLDNFQGTDLSSLEAYINRRFEASDVAFSDAELNDPSDLVQELKDELQNASPGLSKELESIIDGSAYINSVEQFWFIADYLGKNTHIFAKLPPETQSRMARYFLAKREQLEKPLISGSIAEQGTIVWRTQALQQGHNVLEKTDEVAEIVRTLGEKMLSTDEGVAQKALQDLKSYLDSYDFFLEITGADALKLDEGDISESQKEALFGRIPELEQGLLENVLALHSYVGQIRESYKTLNEERDEFQTLLDTEPERVKELLEEYEAAKDQYQAIVDSGKSGIDTKGPLIDFDSSRSGADTDGGVGGGNIETIGTTTERLLNRLRETLFGPSDSEDGGLVGKVTKIENFTFTLPGDLKASLEEITRPTKKSINARVKEIGLKKGEDITKVRPSFDQLARMDMGARTADQLEPQARELLQNEAAQQFEVMKTPRHYNSLRTLHYVPSKYQKNLTIGGLIHASTIDNAIYVRQESDGSILYHTKMQIIKVNPPRLSNDDGDQRNLSIWQKRPGEQGANKPFTMPTTEPDMVGMYLTSDPENKAAIKNRYYGKPIESKIKQQEKEVASQAQKIKTKDAVRNTIDKKKELVDTYTPSVDETDESAEGTKTDKKRSWWNPRRWFSRQKSNT